MTAAFPRAVGRYCSPKKAGVAIGSAEVNTAMRFMDPIRINDWEIWTCLRFVISFQCTLMAVFVLDSIGFPTQFARALLGFIFVLFVPGVLLLRILGVHKRSAPETLLYSVGLSVSMLMAIGALMNAIYPLFGVARPITIIPMIITINAVVLMLCGVSYLRDKEYADPDFIQIQTVLNRPALFFYILPLLTVIGTFFVNTYNNNVFLLILIGLIALVAILAACDVFVPRTMYPLAILSISISLLLHTSLVSTYLWGFDVHYEHFVAAKVLSSGFWDNTVPGNVNAVLSIAILAPLLSIMSDLSLTWIFKVVYPLIFALVPLGLFQVFRSQMDAKIAFLAAFFFATLFTFYAEMPSLGRQEIAELFLVLILMLMVSRNLGRVQNAFFFGIFGAAMAVSHYGLAYIYMFSLAVAWFVLKITATASFKSTAGRVEHILSRLPFNGLRHNQLDKAAEGSERAYAMSFNGMGYSQLDETEPHRSITALHVLYFALFTNIWYIFVAGGTAFTTVRQIADNIQRNLIAELFSQASSEGMNILMNQPVSFTHTIAKYMHLFTLFLIAVGVVGILINYNKINTKRDIRIGKEFAVLSAIFLFIGFAGIAVPHVAESLNTARLYQISLIFLAPYCVIGGILLFTLLPFSRKAPLRSNRDSRSIQTLAVLFSVILLFNTGWLYEVAHDHPTSLALSADQITEYGTAEEKSVFFGNYVPEYDVFSSIWLSGQRDSSSLIYADRLRKDNVLSSYGFIDREPPFLTNSTIYLLEDSYVFLGYCNIVESIGSGSDGRYSELWDIKEHSSVWMLGNTIYSNRYSEVKLTSPMSASLRSSIFVETP